jgi:hypothetical protein
LLHFNASNKGDEHKKLKRLKLRKIAGVHLHEDGKILWIKAFNRFFICQSNFKSTLFTFPYDEYKHETRNKNQNNYHSLVITVATTGL